MVVEHEVIEQVEEEPSGRPLPWVCDMLRRLGQTEPMNVLLGMWRGGFVTFGDDAGREMPAWACEAIFRVGDESPLVHVRATEAGSRWVHG